MHIPKVYTVDFQHSVFQDWKLSVTGFTALNANDAEAMAKRMLSAPEGWDCVGVDAKELPKVNLYS